jgi:hypothetical protein
MGQFLQINGDYNIKVANGAQIVLDTGITDEGIRGKVEILGDLIVQGDTISVETVDLAVNDNVIKLNNGETGPGVTLFYSGIEIDRGDTSSVDPLVEPANNASFLWDDTTNSWLLANGSTPGPFNFNFSRLRLKEILTNANTDNGDLTLIGTGTGVVKVSGTDNYEQQVIDPDDIPNKQYVDESILNNPSFQIVSTQNQDTKVIIADKDVSPNLITQYGSLAYFSDQTGYTTDSKSAVSILVDGTLVSQFYKDFLLVGDPGVDGIEIDGTNFEIRTEESVSNQNIFVKTAGTGKLQTNYALQLTKIGAVPASVSNSTLLYAATPGVGSTGLWFVNDNVEVARRDDELISKNKALVFSMLF